MKPTMQITRIAGRDGGSVRVRVPVRTSDAMTVKGLVTSWRAPAWRGLLRGRLRGLGHADGLLGDALGLSVAGLGHLSGFLLLGCELRRRRRATRHGLLGDAGLLVGGDRRDGLLLELLGFGFAVLGGHCGEADLLGIGEFMGGHGCS
jgi:hypothetical protein